MNRGAIVFRPEGLIGWRVHTGTETDGNASGRHSAGWHSTPLTLFAMREKEVSMRFGVSIILLVGKRKEGSDSNPKGIGNVASRPCVLEFVLVACGPGLVGGRYRLVVDSVARGCTWTPRLLATTALLWAWSDEGTLVDRFWAVRRIVLHLFSRRRRRPAPTRPLPSCCADGRWNWSGCCNDVRERMRKELAGSWRVGGFVTFAVDGSRAELPGRGLTKRRIRSRVENVVPARDAAATRAGESTPRNRIPRSCG